MLPDPIHVLMVDHDEDDYVLVRNYLAEASELGSYYVEWAGTFDLGRESARRSGADLILLDYRLGARTGTRRIGSLRELLI